MNNNLVKKVIFKNIKFYQDYISPNLGHHCRFYPSCSQYMYLSVEKYGVKKGVWKGVKRIIRCNPWNSGGVDMP